MTRTGRVAAFDEARGIGEVETAGGARWAFHCTAVVDGSRTIEVGTAVRFRLVAGHGGRREATALVPP